MLEGGAAAHVIVHSLQHRVVSLPTYSTDMSHANMSSSRPWRPGGHWRRSVAQGSYAVLAKSKPLLLALMFVTLTAHTSQQQVSSAAPRSSVLSHHPVGDVASGSRKYWWIDRIIGTRRLDRTTWACILWGGFLGFSSSSLSRILHSHGVFSHGWTFWECILVLLEVVLFGLLFQVFRMIMMIVSIVLLVIICTWRNIMWMGKSTRSLCSTNISATFRWRVPVKLWTFLWWEGRKLFWRRSRTCRWDMLRLFCCSYITTLILWNWRSPWQWHRGRHVD